MIELEVEYYCQQCLDFSPDVIKPERIRLSDGSLGYTNTVVQCKYHKRCAGIKRYLENQIKGATDK